MSTEIRSEERAEVFQLEAVELEFGQPPLSSIDCDFGAYSFRVEEELGDEAIKPLAEDIAVNGLITPLTVVKMPDGRFKCNNGHRRVKALWQLVSQGVDGFNPDMKVPAHIMVSGPSELAQVARAVAANVQQRTLSPEGRLKAVIRLKKLGMPNKDIARCVGKSESTVDRDLALARSGCMLDHIRDNDISGTDAAVLVKTAEKADRVDDLCEAFEGWCERTRALVEAEQRRREENDEEPLSPSDKWLRRYLTADQVKEWKLALEKGLPLQDAQFRYRAQIRQAQGQRRIVVDGLSENLDELSAKDLAKLLVRFVDLAEDLKPLVEEKARAEREAQKSLESSPRRSKGRSVLEELELAHLLEAEESEPDFDVEIDETVGTKVVADDVDYVEAIDDEDEAS